MKKICIAENVTWDETTLHKIYNSHRGDLRSCISTLQAMYYLFQNINQTNFSEFILELNMNELSEKIETCTKSTNSNYVSMLQEYAFSFNEMGISPRTLLRGMISWLLDNGTDEQNYEFAGKVSLLERQSTVVKNGEIMMLHCLLTFFKLFSKII
jgi:DNA polymerase III delta prime subunit